MQAGLALLQDPEHPNSMKVAAAAAKRAWARAALRVEHGNIQHAADLVGVSRRTLVRAALESSVPPTPGPWHYSAVHAQFDDQLFPFIRIMWPSEPEPAWLDDYGAWVLNTIIPRAIDESVKVVSVDNFSQMAGLPSASFLAALSSFNSSVGATASPRSAGAILYAPTLPLGGVFAPLINMAPISTKLATTPAKVSELATSFFNSAGISVPSNLSLD